MIPTRASLQRERESWPLERSFYTEETKKELTVQPVSATPEKEKWWTRFSKWKTVVGVVSTMFSWKYRSLMKFEINRKAEYLLFRIIQKECFPEEFRSLTANHKVQRDSKLIQFRPFLGDDGLIRASRRLQLSDLEEDTKHPVIMADHVLTVLLFRFIHESNMHLGVEGCVALARRRFATIACRRLFRRIQTRCTVCKRFDGPSGSEVSPPLPVDRVTLQRPFSVVGIDQLVLWWQKFPVLAERFGFSWLCVLRLELSICNLFRVCRLKTLSSLFVDSSAGTEHLCL